MNVYITLSKDAKELTRGTEFSTGLDLQAIGYKKIIKINGKNSISNEILLSENDSLILKPRERVLITTGVQLQVESPIKTSDGSYLIVDTEIRPRSGLTLKEGILCQLGTIDVDYRGDIGLSIINLSDEDFVIKKYDRLAQLCFVCGIIPNLIYTDNLNETSRANNGFGSTGI
jgi:dUTP pyrophosphatase